MAKPFTFHFSYGDGDAPRVMLLIDLAAHCSVCGYSETQRFFYGVGFHTFNLPGFAEVVREAASLLSYDCGQCGGPVAATECTRGSVSYAFADGAGILGAIFPVDAGRGVEPRYWIQGGRSLDAQQLPMWEPPPLADLVAPGLTDGDVFRHCGRIVQAKSAWRDLLDDSLTSTDTVIERVASDLWLVAGANDLDVDRALAEDEGLTRRIAEGEVLRVPLVSDETLCMSWSDRAHLVGGARDWLADEIYVRLEAGAWMAYALLDTRRALEALTSTLDLAKLEWALSGSGPEARIVDVTTPRGEVYEPSLALELVLRYAANTGICPGEAGRFVAEHVVASLMGLEL